MLSRMRMRHGRTITPVRMTHIQKSTRDPIDHGSHAGWADDMAISQLGPARMEIYCGDVTTNSMNNRRWRITK